jgi:ABC-type polysaccharide/polyol phosphate export permease
MNPKQAAPVSKVPIKHGHPLYELTRARIVEALRDPTALFWSFGFPVVLVITLGVAFGGGPKSHNRIGYVCGAPVDASACAALQKQLEAGPDFDVRPLALAEAKDQLGLGQLDVVLQAAQEPEQPGATTLVYHFDDNSPEGRTTRLAIRSVLNVPAAGFVIRDQPHSEVGRRYVDLLLPGLLALNLMGGGIWGTSFALVDARRRGLLRQFAVTPMRRSDYLISYMFARLLFLVIEVVFLLGFGAFAFDTVLRGSWFAVTVMCLLGSFAFTGMGLLIAARTQSSEVASGWANALTIPMGLASGVFFDYALFPEFLHPLIRCLPLTALTTGLRAIANQGFTVIELAPQLIVLAGWTIASFAVALRIFRWR